MSSSRDSLLPIGPPAESLPRRFGRYILFDKIGQGGMARIYLGRSELGEKLLVVKQMLAVFSHAPRFSKLLIDEAKLAAGLSNSNIVQVFDLGREEDVLYIAMEYVEGFDLRQLLAQCSKRQVPLPVEFSLFIVSETLKALDHAHKKKDESGASLHIVHRDVSPSNVLLSFHGEVKLCDFGIAKAMVARDEVPDEAIEGKAGYMSPEAARGESLDARTDIFSTGIILWELLAGRKLYRGSEGRPPSLEQAARADVPPLPDRGLLHQDTLYRIVARALATDREERYQTCRDFRRDLDAYIQEAGFMVSQLKFGEWMTANFGSEMIELRRERERGALAWSSLHPKLEEKQAMGGSSPSARPSGSAPKSVRVPEAFRPEPGVASSGKAGLWALLAIGFLMLVALVFWMIR